MEKQYVSVSLTVYCRLGCINKLNPSWSILVCVPVVLYVREGICPPLKLWGCL